MGKHKYLNPASFTQHIKRYNRDVTVPKGYPSDGSTGGVDIYSRSWWVHDKLVDSPYFDDGTYCTAWQGSMIIHDILMDEGHWIRAKTWCIATLMGADWKKEKDNERSNRLEQE